MVVLGQNTIMDDTKWNSSFNFIQGADTQFGMIQTFYNDTSNSNWDAELALTKHAINIINNMVPLPKFFIICGDMVNAYPTQQYKAEQISSLKDTLKNLDSRIKLLCVCGNHDVGNIPTETTIKEYRKDFGPDYYSFWIQGVKFIILNSQYFFNDSLVKNYSMDQNTWLKQELIDGKNKNAKHMMVFQHYPFFLKEPDEPMDYYSFEESKGSYNLPKAIRDEKLALFDEYGVSHIFAGHYHRNAGGFYPRKKGSGNIEMVVTSAIGAQLGVDKSGFRIVSIGPKTIKHEYVAIEDFYNQSDTLRNPENSIGSNLTLRTDAKQRLNYIQRLAEMDNENIK